MINSFKRLFTQLENYKCIRQIDIIALVIDLEIVSQSLKTIESIEKNKFNEKQLLNTFYKQVFYNIIQSAKHIGVCIGK